MSKKTQSDRLKEAAKTLRELQKEIEPFTKPMKMEMPKSHGQWKSSSGNISPEFTRENFLFSLRKVAHPVEQRAGKE